MFVKATDKFEKYSLFPVELGFIPPPDYVFEVTEARYKLLAGDNQFNECFVVRIKDVEVKKARRKGKAENKFAIIVPNRNYAECIEKCLTSILNQTYKKFEIIFIDDCSTDNSVDVAKGLLKKPHKVIQLKQRRYAGGARNEAYLHVSKDVDYITYVDSDDWLLNDNVLMEINAMLKGSPDVLFMGIMEHLNGIESVARMPDYKDRYDALRGWSGCGKVIRKELAIRQECLYSEGTMKEDKNQHCRICINMDSFVCLNKPYYVWNRDNKKSITTIRDKVKWGTSTIRHYADTMELYLTYKGQNQIIDGILKTRLDMMKRELEQGGDRQF